MRRIVNGIGQVIGIVALLAFAVNGLRAQLPTQTTGHLVTAAEYNAIIAAVNAINSVPSGTIAHFNATSCPAGWTEFTSARGLYIVGLQVSGTLNSAVGVSLTNLENRAHTHGVSGTTDNTSVAHAHGVSGTTSGGSGTTAATDVSGTTDVNNNGSLISQGASTTIGVALNGHTHTFDAGTHTHTFTFGGLGFSASTGGMSGNDPHNHTFSATTGNQSATIAPYLQLLVCQKT